MQDQLVLPDRKIADLVCASTHDALAEVVVVEAVIAVAANQGVSTRPAAERVVAVTSDQIVVTKAAQHRVVPSATIQGIVPE